MNLKPNKHKRIPFSTMTMASFTFIGPPKISVPPPNLIFCSGLSPPPNYFGLTFLGSPLKLEVSAIMLRVANVIPIHKKGEKLDPNKQTHLSIIQYK